MKKYSDILKQQTIKKNKCKIPYGWVILKRGKNNELIIEKNKDDFSAEYIDEYVESNRQYNLYLNNIERLVNYKIEEYEKENIDYNIEEILEELGYYDNAEGDDINNCDNENEYSDNEYSD